ncbi:hypothetical protein [Halorubrum sp. FL23]|uniref:hypothetical protein n=1 Tax=Halorubrum sp. FL23 TaxID=3458704 RepID=UPI004033285D
MAEGIQQLDPTEHPTRHAFRIVNDAHTNLCIVGNKIEDDKLAEFEDEACEALIDLFDAMAEQRGLNEQQTGKWWFSSPANITTSENGFDVCLLFDLFVLNRNRG